MSIWTIFFIGLGLAMDAFAVSLSNGMCYRNFGRKQAVQAAVTFGVFQAAMPMIGYVAGQFIGIALSFLDHWVALILLGFIGGSMVWEGIQEIRHPGCKTEKREFTFQVLMAQGLATSLDALAVGVSLAMMSVNILAAGLIIGLVTFGCCIVGVALGKRFGALLGQKARIFGGVLLALIGIRIFLEHMLGGQ